jgi:hypothetical protein
MILWPDWEEGVHTTLHPIKYLFIGKGPYHSSHMGTWILAIIELVTDRST